MKGILLRRVGAVLIDGLVLLPVVLAGLLTSYLVDLDLKWIDGALLLGVIVIYFSFLQARKGASLGERLMRIELVGPNGLPPPLNVCIMRIQIVALGPYLAYSIFSAMRSLGIVSGNLASAFAEGFGYFSVAAFIAPVILTRGHAALHDLLVGTEMRRLGRQSLPASKRLRLIAASLLVAAAAGLSSGSFFMKGMAIIPTAITRSSNQMLEPAASSRVGDEEDCRRSIEESSFGESGLPTINVLLPGRRDFSLELARQIALDVRGLPKEMQSRPQDLAYPISLILQADYSFGPLTLGYHRRFIVDRAQDASRAVLVVCEPNEARSVAVGFSDALLGDLE